MARPLSFLLLALLLGLAPRALDINFLHLVAFGGLLLGYLDPKRSILWTLGMFLPHLAKLVAAVSVTLTIETGLHIPHLLINWGYGHLHPFVHAVFGASIGVVLRVALSRLQTGSDCEPFRVADAVMAAGFVMLAGGADRYASLYFEKEVHLHWPWSVTLTAIALSTLIGLLLMVPSGMRWLAARPLPTIQDTDGIIELFFWGGVFLVCGFRQLMFEGCFQVSSWDVTRCFTLADLPATVMWGLGCGGIIGLFLIVYFWEGITGNRLVLTLRPVLPYSAFSVGVRAVIAVILVQLGYRLFT